MLTLKELRTLNTFDHCWEHEDDLSKKLIFPGKQCPRFPMFFLRQNSRISRWFNRSCRGPGPYGAHRGFFNQRFIILREASPSRNDDLLENFKTVGEWEGRWRLIWKCFLKHHLFWWGGGFPNQTTDFVQSTFQVSRTLSLDWRKNLICWVLLFRLFCCWGGPVP